MEAGCVLMYGGGRAREIQRTSRSCKREAGGRRKKRGEEDLKEKGSGPNGGRKNPSSHQATAAGAEARPICMVLWPAARVAACISCPSVGASRNTRRSRLDPLWAGSDACEDSFAAWLPALRCDTAPVERGGGVGRCPAQAHAHAHVRGGAGLDVDPSASPTRPTSRRPHQSQSAVGPH